MKNENVDGSSFISRMQVTVIVDKFWVDNSQDDIVSRKMYILFFIVVGDQLFCGSGRKF